MKSYSLTKKQLVVVLFCFSFLPLFSQQSVMVEYDAAGNRVLVHQLTLRAPQSRPDGSLYANSSKGGDKVGKTLSDLGKNISATADSLIVNIGDMLDFSSEMINGLTQSSDNSSSPFVVSPNPSRDLIKISEPEESKGLSYNILLYDSYGKMVEHYIDVQAPFVINLANCYAGLYYLKIYRQDIQHVIKIVKI